MPVPDYPLGSTLGGYTVFNVMDFGALGVGTDDTAAIVAAAIACASLGGGIVYLPAGIYGVSVNASSGDVISTALQYALPLYPNVRYLGASWAAVIRMLSTYYYPMGAPANCTMFGNPADAGGCGVESLTLDMGASTNPVGFPSVSPLSAQYSIYVGLYEAPITFRDLHIMNLDCINCITAAGEDLCKIDTCVFDLENNPNDNVPEGGTPYHDSSLIYWNSFAAPNAELRVTNCSARAPVDESGNPAYGARTFVESHGPRQLISGNTCTNMQKFANITGIAAPSSQDIVVIGNKAVNAQYGIQLFAEVQGTSSDTPLQNVSISENVFNLSPVLWNWKYGMIPSPNPFCCGITLDASKTWTGLNNLSIVGNIIAYQANGALSQTDPNCYGSGMNFLVESSSPASNYNWSITGNIIDSPSGPGMHFLYTTNAGMILSGNTIRNPGQNPGMSGAGFYSGILLSGNGSNIQISDNEIFDDQATATMKYGINLIAAATSGQNISNLTVTDNPIWQSSTPSIVPVFCDTYSGNSRYPFIRQVCQYASLPTGNSAFGSTMTDYLTGKIYTQVDIASGALWTVAPAPVASQAAGGSTYTILPTGGANVTSTYSTTGAQTINLPSSPFTGETHTIVDAGGNAGAAGRNITIASGSANIFVPGAASGVSSITIATNYGLHTLLWTGSAWIQTA